MTVNDEELVEVIAKAIAREWDTNGTGTFIPATVFAIVARDAIRSAGFQVSPVEDRSSWVYCPICGRKNRPRDGSDDVTEVYCSPTNCEAWKVTATFDHESREWVPADSGGSG